MQVQNDTCLAAAMERYVAAKTAYEALFDSIDPMFSPGRCKQHTDSLVWARVELQRHTEQAVGSGLVERAQEMLQAPVHRGGFAVKPESLEPPEVAETLYANT